MKDASRAELADAIRERIAREQAQWTVLFSEAAAGLLGIRATDLRYLDAVRREGPLTAGRLAELTGLTTGAVTGVIDRLERAGYVARQQDRADRRRVIVRLVPERMRDVGAVFGPSQQAWAERFAAYTDDELRFIAAFMRDSTDMLREQTHLLQTRAQRRGAARKPANRRRLAQ